MTETLKNALHEHALAADFASADLAAIRSDGNRALRRRRVGLLGATAAVVAASVVAVVAVTSSPGATRDDGLIATDRRGADDAASAVAPEVTWVEGSTLHGTESGETDLGRRAVAYVRTSVGYVFADETGGVFSLVGGDVAQVGSTDPDAIRLVSDPGGPLAVWLDADGTGIASYDQASGADLILYERVSGSRPELTSLDGDAVYLDTGSQTHRVSLSDGTVTVAADDGGRVLDASGALLAIEASNAAVGEVVEQRVSLVGPDGSTTLPGDFGSDGVFSPDGAWYSGEADEPQVVSAATGERVIFDAPEFFATGYEWLDSTTLVMISQEAEGAPIRLLTCRVPDGACEEAAEVGRPALLEDGFTIPVGERT